MEKKYFTLFLMLGIFTLSNAIEVGGPIYEDTTWSPLNNPYEVIEDIIVSTDVTLTILPGTDIKIGSKAITSANSWSYGVVAKAIKINGRIIAIGTQQENITFSSLGDAPNHSWGAILSTNNADMSIFEYCDFQESAGRVIAGRDVRAALEFDNDDVFIRNCLFKNNWQAINLNNSHKRIELVNNTFTYDNNYNSFIQDNRSGLVIIPDDEQTLSLIAGNSFIKSKWIRLNASYFVDNFVACTVKSYENVKPAYFYDNDFVENSYGILSDGIVCYANSVNYIKNNTLSNVDGVEIEDCIGEIVGNQFNSSTIRAYYCTETIISHNIIDDNVASNPAISTNCGVVSNNIIKNAYVVFSGAPYQEFSNNLFINNSNVFSSLNDDTTIKNQIFVGNDDTFMYFDDVNGTPIFRNCILDFEIPQGCIDGGGNHIIDPSQVPELFADYLNEDFHFSSGSLGIDAGFNAPGYYPFDMDYNQRVSDGDGDGNARVDIGPYEYGSEQSGRICGFITESDSEDPIDYVFISVDNDPGNYTFADSAGYFEINLPEGTYDLYAKRVFYEPRIIGSVDVLNAEPVFVFFDMVRTQDQVDYQDDQVPENQLGITLSNYPNPFNPSTTIEFSLSSELYEQDEQMDIDIFNIKGQRVNNFVCHPEPDEGHTNFTSITWNGTDSNNTPVSSGIYFAILKSNKKVLATTKMILLK